MSWREWTAFAVLCGWQASSWLLPTNSEGPSKLERFGIASGLLAVLGFAWILFRKRAVAERNDLRTVAPVGMAGILMFAVPAMLLQRASEYSPETNATVIFALAPIMVVLAWAAASSAQRDMTMLLPALAGSAGVLLILPFEWPASARGWESLAEIVAAMLLVAGAGVWLHALLRRRNVAEIFALVSVFNAAVLLLWCGLRGELVLRGWGLRGWGSTMSEAAVFALTVWLVKAMEPVRFSARFLIIPLLTIVEGIVLLRPEFNGRLVVGLVLLLAGAGWLLRGRETVGDEVLSLR